MKPPLEDHCWLFPNSKRRACTKLATPRGDDRCECPHGLWMTDTWGENCTLSHRCRRQKELGTEAKAEDKNKWEP